MSEGIQGRTAKPGDEKTNMSSSCCPLRNEISETGLNDIQCFNQRSDDRDQGQGDHGREKHVNANGKSEGKEEKHPVTAGGFLIH